MKIPRFLIAAPSSGSGKTLVTCGLLQALVKRGMKVSSFKCGPDYIDPMFHSQVIGAKSRNLDPFFTGRDVMRALLAKNAKDSQISLIEGVMGYYDGLAGKSAEGSAWHVASMTGTPAILLVDGKGASLSILALVKGFLEYLPESYIKGVILNRISPMFYPTLKALLEDQLDVKVLGYLPIMQDIHLESRHLGLVMPEEIQHLQEDLDLLADTLEKTLDMEAILALAAGAEEVEEPEDVFSDLWKDKGAGERLRIGLAKDEAFCFFYEDNLTLLQEMGAELVAFSPIHDKTLPKGLDGLLLHGGYPELYGRQLSENEAMRRSIREALEKGLPCIAECGGFMYLHEFMEDQDGSSYPMVGYIEGKVHKTPRLTRFGYISLDGGKVFGREIGEIPSHEFHYYDSDNCGDAFLARKPLSERSWPCIHSSDHLFAGYPHLYYYGNPKFAETFLKTCRERKKTP